MRKINGREQHIHHCSDASGRWQNLPASTISHHGRPCCEIARQWMLAMDFSQLNGASVFVGPRWLRQKFKWGPSPWPIHWCEVVRRRTIDCGALAALSYQLFVGRGVRSYPAQFILRFTDAAGRQWLANWSRNGDGVHWINDRFIYHEGCAVAPREREIKLWDATATWWIDPKQLDGYGALLAVRVFDQSARLEESFSWGGHQIVPNQWQKITAARDKIAAGQCLDGGNGAGDRVASATVRPEA